jgi:hypothetical protein
MSKHFDRPLPKSNRDIFLMEDKYYFFDEDCFGIPIQYYRWPITPGQILDNDDSPHSAKLILEVLSGLPKFRSCGVDSYQLKHLLERYIVENYKMPCYFTNDEGKLLMLAAGFTPTNKDKINWRWNTSLPELNYHFFGVERRQKSRPLFVKVKPRPQ